MNESRDSGARVFFLFDVDNTLLDNDRVAADLQRHLVSEVGPDGAQEYSRIFEQLRAELGYTDYLGALQRYRVEHPRDARNDPRSSQGGTGPRKLRLHNIVGITNASAEAFPEGTRGRTGRRTGLWR